jgi:hypothetical protein
VHLGNAPVGSARPCRVRRRVSVVERGRPLPPCDLRKEDRPYAPRAEAKAPAAVAALWRAEEGWRTPKAWPRHGASTGAACECARGEGQAWPLGLTAREWPVNVLRIRKLSKLFRQIRIVLRV